MASEIIDNNYRTYQAHQGGALVSEVAVTVCIMLPRAFAVAGFGRGGEVLLVHYNSYPSDLPEWNKVFLEQQLINDPLLALPQQVKAIFVGTEQQLLVPQAFYDETQSAAWLQSIFPVMPMDTILTVYAPGADGRYLFAVPEAVISLSNQYLPHASVLPLPAYQLKTNDPGPGAFLQALITAEAVFATMTLDSRIIWHQVFAYTHAADIAWQVSAVCKQWHIPIADFRFKASIVAEDNYEELLELETYFPKLEWAVRARPELGAWEPVICLMEQLYACVL